MTEPTTLHSLARFQTEAMNALVSTITMVSSHIAQSPSMRRKIALQSGVMLLQSPTGSGKTLTLGRTIEQLIGKLETKCVWFWFAPYSGIVDQTRDSLTEQCPRIRVRDVTKDRSPVGVRDGDVFIQTWSAVAANKKEAKRVRRTSEEALSLDDMLEALRADGISIGVVIDEAHLNFGESAKAAASFYLDVLQPDFTLLATATPNDDKLQAFEKSAKVELKSRIVIDRARVVDAGLNKIGLKLGYLKMNPGDEALVDHEFLTLTAAWTQHSLIRKTLEDKGIKVVPLMLVQVEDQQEGSQSPMDRVKSKLLEIPGVTEDMISVHTSGEPDPEFHTMAYDHSKQILIFKVAVATGFDAPRAWTLVSTRPNRGVGFGLQIVGRIMRVHNAVRPLHGKGGVLDSGYVFLTDPTVQQGLNSAVEELKAVRQSMSVLSDKLDVLQYDNGLQDDKTLIPDAYRVKAPVPAKPLNSQERQERLSVLIDEGFVSNRATSLPESQIDDIILAGEGARQMVQTPLFGNLPVFDAPSVPAPRKGTPYYLNKSLGLPYALWQEHPLEIEELNSPDFLSCIAQTFCDSSALVGRISQSMSRASMKLRDLFNEGEEEEVSLSVKLSNSRVADRAQLSLQLNDSIDSRLLEQALISALRQRADEGGYDYREADLQRTIHLAVMRDKQALLSAIKTEQGKRARLKDNEPIPEVHFDYEGLDKASKSAYGVFPSRMNSHERAFAEFLESDKTGTVLWWLRNPENEKWATRLILPTGTRFFPDFVVGIKGRSTRDCIALVEIKDDGTDGRLHSDKNREKIQVQHREYRNVFWSTKEGDQLIELEYNAALNLIQMKQPFDIKRMVYLV